MTVMVLTISCAVFYIVWNTYCFLKLCVQGENGAYILVSFRAKGHSSPRRKNFTVELTYHT